MAVLRAGPSRQSRYAEIEGIKAAANLDALAMPPDVLVVTAPAPAVPAIIATAGSKGIAAAVIISAGLGHGPGSLADAARTVARDHGVRLLGPNGIDR